MKKLVGFVNSSLDLVLYHTIAIARQQRERAAVPSAPGVMQLPQSTRSHSSRRENPLKIGVISPGWPHLP